MDIEKGSIFKNPIHIEVCLKSNVSVSKEKIKDGIIEYLFQYDTIIEKPGIYEFLTKNDFLSKYIEFMRIESRDDISWPLYLHVEKYPLDVNIFRLEDDAPSDEFDENGDISSCHIVAMPNRRFDDLWDSLIFEGEIKNQLLDYASTAMLFSEKKVNSSIITWNRVILLYGPPGTGKTSLCKALAQKISIRLSSKYNECFLIEINAHSLFSKWFSESGKLVMKMFAKIKEYIDIPDSFVCILIDEVESLTKSRKQSMEGEPSDAIRAVNAVLTEIDKLKNESNVMILTTSNITEAIDDAFLDRADIKKYIGLPGEKSRSRIILSCVDELKQKGIIRKEDDHNPIAESLFSEIIQRTEGLSGRALRKLPFIAHALHIKSPTTSMEEFMRGILKALDE